MKATAFLSLPRLCVWAFSLASVSAVAAPKCDEISNDVRKAVAADPAKTLMVVEDALVINESCACEIVRAAIEASKADETMKQQIVQTALAVAPKMAPVITECMNTTGAVPVAYQEPTPDPTDSGKNAKNAKSVLPVMPPAPVEDVEDFAYLPRDIRGIYLIAPGGVGVIGARTVEEVCKDDKNGGGGNDSHKPRRRITSPISRSVASTP